MKYFKASEFHGWYDRMNKGLLTGLDALRELWGKPIYTSNDLAAAGRSKGKADTSQHNFDRYGQVNAIDVKPSGIETAEDARRFFDLAVACGFTGIGFYPDWNQPGFHLDVRCSENEMHIASWGRLPADNARGWVDVGIQTAFARLPAVRRRG